MSRTTALAVGGALSIALHLALAPLLDSIGGRPGRPGAPGPVRSVQLRTLVAATPEAGLSVPPVALEAPGAVAREPDRPPSSRSADGVLPAEVRSDAPDPKRQAGERGDDAYLPRSALTVVPGPSSVVLIDYPQFEGDQGQYTVQISLFIDEAGSVRRVEFDRRDLPEPLQRVIREAFANTAFTPGELEGQAVRSHIRIEVSFKTTPMPR